MPDTSGFFLKGFAGAIKGMPQRIYEIRWRKKQEDKLEKKQDELIELTSLYSKTAEQLGADGFYSDDDLMKLNTIVLTGGTEFQEIIKGTHSHIQGMNKSQVEKDMDLVDSFIEMSKGMNLKELDESLEMLRGFVKSESALNKLAAYDSLYKKKHEIQPPPEVFPTAAGVQEAYPEEGYKYTKEGYVPEFIKPTTEKAPTAIDQKIAGIDNLPIPEDQKLEMKIGVYGGGDSATEAKVKAIYAAGGTNEDVVKALGGGVIGPEPPPTPKVTPPVPTTTENIREDILGADTFEDAQRIHKNYVAKYGEETLGIADLEKEWSNVQVSHLDLLNRTLNNIIDEKGWLKKGMATKEQIGLKPENVADNKERNYEEFYEILRKQYTQYRDMLEKMGVDVSQYPEILPLEEIKRVGGLEGALGIGVKGIGIGIKKGDYKSIYK